jgi:uncharacterized protein (DUF488 family)
MITESTKIYTIGFTKKTAEEFFAKIRDSGVQRIVDVRLNNTSQLAGFSKRDDLVFFLREIVGIDYVHIPDLAPTQDILDAFKKHKGSWDVYEEEFLTLMEKRRIDKTVARNVLSNGCLLCSEHQPHHCHRRLVTEFLERKWGGVETTHLL